MLFAIADDNCVKVFGSESAVHIECEAIDVRNGVYAFFAEDGRRLVPTFQLPEQKGLFAFMRKSSPEFRLAPETAGTNTENAFALAAQSIAGVEPNPHFTSIHEILAHIQGLRDAQHKLTSAPTQSKDA